MVVESGEEARMDGEDERDETGGIDGADCEDEARLSTLAGGGDEAGGVDEPEDDSKPDVT